MKAIFLLSLLFIFSTSTFCIDFAIKIPRNQKKCFSETLEVGTLVKTSFESEDPDYNELVVNVYDSAGKSLYAEPFQGAKIKLSFTTTTEGETSVCVQNTGKKFLRIFFTFTTGAEAGDISEAASDVDLKPVERNLAQVDRIMQQLQTATSMTVRQEEIHITASDSVNRKLYFFSGLTIVVILAVAVVQVKFLERQLRTKKLI